MGNPPFATGIDLTVFPQFINANRAPTSQDLYNPGTRWLDQSVSPAIIYETIGSGVWKTGAAGQAITTAAGITRYATTAEVLAGTGTNNAALAADVFTLAQSIVVGAVPQATTVISGIGQLATDAEAVAGTASTGTLALLVTPSNLTPVFAAPPAIGGTTRAAALFTTLGANGLITGTASMTISTGATALNLGTDSADGAVNLGTVASTGRVVTV